jgi:hypothetical protein
MDFSGSDVVGELKLTGYPKRWGSRQSILSYNIRQYMSYKIVSYALMKHINNDSQINVLLPASVNPCSGVMNVPQRLSPDQLPDPWLLDTEGLLSPEVSADVLVLHSQKDSRHNEIAVFAL